MPTFPGLYRAKAVQKTGSLVSAFIPQIFGTTQVTITEFVGTPPAAKEMGWVAFQNGAPEYPVWFGNSTGGGGTVTDVVWNGPDAPGDQSIEMWWDTDEPSPTGTKPTVPAAATDPATTMALANSLRAALITLGLVQ